MSEDSVRALIPWRSRSLYIIIASSLIGVMGISLISPVLPQLRPVFGVSDAEIGLVITAYTVPGIVVTPFVGLLADRLGRKRLLVPLLLTFGIAGAAVGMTRDFSIILILRFLQGVGGSALTTIAITLLGDIYDGQQLDAIIGFNASTLGIGGAFYPLIGGLLAGLRWYGPFLFFGVSVIVGLAALLVLVEPETGPPMDTLTYLAEMARVARMPLALAVFGALLAAMTFFYGAVITALPLLLTDQFGLDPGQIGTVLAVTALSSSIVTSQYGRFTGIRTAPELIALGFVGFGLSLLCIWVSTSIYLVGVSLIFYGVGFGVVMPSIDTTMVNLVSDDLRAGMMSLRTSMLRLGQTIGPAGFTLFAGTYFATNVQGYRTLILVSGVIVVGCGSLGYLLLRR